MGCGNTKVSAGTSQSIDGNVQNMIEAVQSTWPKVKKIDNLGPKIVAHLLHVYPILKRMSKVTFTLKTEADLLRVNEVRELGNMLLALYSDVIKHAHINLDERIRSKAGVLVRQRIKPRLITHYGESFFHIATHQIDVKLSRFEKDSWEYFINYVSSQLIAQMAVEGQSEINV